jgi:uncharacterized protein YdaU (DUF1376 family)
MSAKDHPPSFQFYPADFASDGIVEAMTTEEVGAYILLLCKAWYEKPVGSIPDDDRILARWSRLDLDRWLECKNNVLRAFTLGTDSRWHQKRLRAERQRQVEFKKKQSDAGKRGAANRWGATTSIGSPCDRHSDPNAIALANDSSSSSYSSSSSLNTPLPPKGGKGFLKGPGVNTLRDPARLLEWLKVVGTTAGLLDDRETQIRVLACAERAQRIAKDKPAFFAKLICDGIKGDWSKIDGELAAATTTLRSLGDGNVAAAVQTALGAL